MSNTARRRPAAGSPHVLIVEGQAAERTVLADIVRREGLTLTAAASSSAEALALLGRMVRPPDVICVSWLVDGLACGSTAWSLISQLHERCPDSRLLMSCPVERAALVRVAWRHGVRCLYATRDGFESLRDALRHAVRGESYLSPRLEKLISQRDAMNPRQLEILNLMAQGTSRPRIAEQLGLSEDTVRSHTKAIYKHLGVNERAHAVAVALRDGLIY